MKILFKLTAYVFLYLGTLSILNPSFGKDPTTNNKSANTFDAQSGRDLDSLRKQLASHWIIPADTKVLQNDTVDIQVEMNPNATVRSATVLSTSKSMSDPHMKAIADSAVRAIKNASPLKLPLDHYDQWKTMVIHFDHSVIL